MMTTRKMKSTSQKQPRNGFVVMGRLIGLVRPLMGFMVLAILMGLAGNLCATFIPIFGGYALLRVLGVETFLPLGGLFAAVLIFALVRGGLRYAEQSCNHYIAFSLLAIIRDKVFQALRKLCPAKLEGRDRGDLISVITSDIELLEVFYAHTISPVAIALLFTVVMLVFLGACHWAYALLALCAYLTVGIVVPLIAAKGSGDTGLQFRTASGDLSSHVLDTLRGLDEILQFNAGEARLEEMIRKTEDLSRLESRMKFAAGLNSAATGLVILLFDVAALVLGVSLHLSGAVSFQNVLVPVLALFSSFGPCTALAALGTTLQQTLAAGNRVLDILEETPAVSEITGQKEVSFQGARLDHVSFSYGADAASSSGGSNGGSNGSSSRDSGSSGTSADSSAEKSGCSSNAVLPVLQDLTLEIPQGKIIGIVGRSGSGKSTILKLLMRFWTVQEGRVSVSGTDVNQINTANLRNLEGFVTQDTHLFRDSIRNNVRIAKLDATDEEIEEACRKASVHDFILSLPQGYDTPVGELGDTLSGGERQRIGLARAFLHDAPLMLLDEPTSNLDSLNEAVILRSLHQQRQDRTVVLVSHRQSTMKIADQTISIENGRMS